MTISSGEEHDSERFIEVMEDIRVKHFKGRPREVHVDSAYDTKEIRTYLKKKDIKANISVNPRNRRKPKRGRPCKLDEESYKQMRSSVERFFTWLKSFRRLTIRYGKLKTTFTALMIIACILIYLRVLQ